MNRPAPASHHCRHYSYEGTIASDGGGPRCASGVDLKAPRACLPCMPNAKEADACELREEYLPAERDAWEAWRNERAGRMLEILRLLPGSSRGKDRSTWGKSGEFGCPACDWGIVRWVRARSNGHVRAACSTVDCFGIME